MIHSFTNWRRETATHNRVRRKRASRLHSLQGLQLLSSSQKDSYSRSNSLQGRLQSAVSSVHKSLLGHSGSKHHQSSAASSMTSSMFSSSAASSASSSTSISSSSDSSAAYSSKICSIRRRSSLVSGKIFSSFSRTIEH